jgi:hypothetical protein
MFDDKSRYLKVDTYAMRDRRGRAVTVVAVPEPPNEPLAGYHLLRQGQRLDHLAQKYLDDPAAFWRICEENGVMQAEQLSESLEIAVPTKAR